MTGRKRIELTNEQRAEVETLAAVLSQDLIAEYFGISRSTFAAMMLRDNDILTRYKKGKAKAIASIANTLIQKAKGGDAACMMFYLKTQAGWRERDPVESVILKTIEPDKLPLIDFTKFTKEELPIVRKFLTSVQEES